MDEPVADGVGQRGVADRRVPALDRALAGDDGGSGLVAVLDDLHEVLALGTRILHLDAVPRAIVNRSTKGLFKVSRSRATDAYSACTSWRMAMGRWYSPGVCAIKKGMTVSELAEASCPYLTMAEGLKLAAQTFTRDVKKLSCCAA